MQFACSFFYTYIYKVIIPPGATIKHRTNQVQPHRCRAPSYFLLFLFVRKSTPYNRRTYAERTLHEHRTYATHRQPYATARRTYAAPPGIYAYVFCKHSLLDRRSVAAGVSRETGKSVGFLPRIVRAKHPLLGTPGSGSP